MFLKNMKAMALKCGLYGRGRQFFVAVALSGDVVVTEEAYLVMVNHNGDRVAVKYPGQDWIMDEKVIIMYNAEIPNYVNALRLPGLRMENK